MKGLLTKDFLTVKKKYGIARLIMDLAIIAALMIILEGAGSIYISFLLVPLEVASMLIPLPILMNNGNGENMRLRYRSQKSRLSVAVMPLPGLQQS